MQVGSSFGLWPRYSVVCHFHLPSLVTPPSPWLFLKHNLIIVSYFSNSFVQLRLLSSTSPLSILFQLSVTIISKFSSSSQVFSNLKARLTVFLCFSTRFKRNGEWSNLSTMRLVGVAFGNTSNQSWVAMARSSRSSFLQGLPYMSRGLKQNL